MRYALAAILPDPAGVYETGSRLHSDDIDDRGHDAERHGDPGARHDLRDVDRLALTASGAIAAEILLGVVLLLGTVWLATHLAVLIFAPKQNPPEGGTLG